MIRSQTYSTNNITLNKDTLSIYINNFWSDVFKSVSEKHLMLMCKVEFTNEMGYRSLGNLRAVNFKDKELFLNYLTQRLGVLTEGYSTTPIIKISFTYIIKDGLATEHKKLLKDNVTTVTVATHRFNNMMLPLSMNPADYGTIIASESKVVEGKNIFRTIVQSGDKIFQIDKFVNKLLNLTIQNVTILGPIDLTWIDTLLHNGVVKRVIGKSEIYFIDGNIVLRKKALPSKPFTKVNGDNKL